MDSKELFHLASLNRDDQWNELERYSWSELDQIQASANERARQMYRADGFRSSQYSDAMWDLANLAAAVLDQRPTTTTKKGN